MNNSEQGESNQINQQNRQMSGVIQQPVAQDTNQGTNMNKYAKKYEDCRPKIAKSSCSNNQTNIMVIIDASSSINVKIDGEEKMSIAKRSAAKFVDSLKRM